MPSQTWLLTDADEGAALGDDDRRAEVIAHGVVIWQRDQG
jgi:hypothetical protein